MGIGGTGGNGTGGDGTDDGVTVGVEVGLCVMENDQAGWVGGWVFAGNGLPWSVQ